MSQISVDHPLIPVACLLYLLSRANPTAKASPPAEPATTPRSQRQSDSQSAPKDPAPKGRSATSPRRSRQAGSSITQGRQAWRAAGTPRRAPAEPAGDPTQPKSDSQTAQRTQPRRGGQPPASGSHARQARPPKDGARKRPKEAAARQASRRTAHGGPTQTTRRNSKSKAQTKQRHSLPHCCGPCSLSLLANGFHREIAELTSESSFVKVATSNSQICRKAKG